MAVEELISSVLPCGTTIYVQAFGMPWKMYHTLKLRTVIQNTMRIDCYNPAVHIHGVTIMETAVEAHW